MANMNIYNMTDTWSSGTTTYSAIKMNVTDNGSASDSKILQLQVGGGDKLVLVKSGNVGIGTSNPIQPLHVQGDVLITSHSAIGNNATVNYANTTSVVAGNPQKFNLVLQDSVTENLSVSGSTVYGGLSTLNEYNHTGTTTGNANVYGGRFVSVIGTNSSGPLAYHIGVHPRVYNYGSGNITGQYSYWCTNYHLGTGTINDMVAAEARNYVQSTGNVTNSYNYDCVTYLTGSGNISRNHGLMVYAPIATGSGRITNWNYGIAVQNQNVTAVTANTNYNIYSEGATSKNLFEGIITAGRIEVTSSTVPPNGMYLAATNRISVATNTTERATVDSNGNVGIGTSSPTNTLSVYGGNVQVGSSGKGIVFPDGTFQVSAPGTWSQVTSNVTAVSGQWLMCDTTTNAISITLPASPSVNTAIKVNAGPSASTNNLTMVRNGSTIMSLAEDMIISDNNLTVEFVYSGTTWRIA